MTNCCNACGHTWENDIEDFGATTCPNCAGTGGNVGRYFSMMEYGDIGIKDEDDIERCFKAGATAQELINLFGDRIEGMVLNFLGTRIIRSQKLGYHLACTQCGLGVDPNGYYPDYPDPNVCPGH